MKILIVTATYAPSINGVALSVKLQKDELIKRGHSVTVVAPMHPKQKKEKNVLRLPSLPNLKVPDFPIIVPFPGRGSHLNLLEKKFDLVFFHHPFYVGTLSFSLAKIYKCPTVFFYHSQYEKYAEAYFPKILPAKTIKKIVTNSVNGTMESADAVIVETATMKNLLQKTGLNTPIEIITSGRNVPSVNKNHVSALRESLGIKKTDRVILNVARLSTEKNIIGLINIFSEVVKRVGDVKLILVGDGPQKDKLKDLVKTKHLTKSVKFAGLVPNEKIFDYYAAADIFAYTSRTDTQAIVILEAMISGLPVIGFKAPGPIDFVEDKKSGYLAGNRKDFMEKTVSLLSDPKLMKAMSEKSKAISLTYTFEGSIDKLENFLQKVIKNRRN
jgi:glycosyltransferase involved in cell wall biosynthesis